jgi:hypothetical protein
LFTYRELSTRELDAMFGQSPVAMVFNDRELRTRRTKAAFRRLTGLPDEAVTAGRSPGPTANASAAAQHSGTTRH